MKGLLHRLAARATGTALPVHSNARLPFSDIDMTWIGDTPGPDDTPPPGTQDGTIASAPAPVATAGTPAETGMPQDVTEPAPMLPDFHETASHRPAVATPSALPERTDRSGSPVPSEHPAIRARVAATEAKETFRESPHAGTDSRPRTDTTETATSTGPERQAGRHDRHAVHAPFTAPPPMMPPAPVSTTAPTPLIQHPRIAQPEAPVTRPGDEPHEVHIHIGRIEVTAAHEKAPVRPGPKARKPALSLDAYLDARSKA